MEAANSTSRQLLVDCAFLKCCLEQLMPTSSPRTTSEWLGTATSKFCTVVELLSWRGADMEQTTSSPCPTAASFFSSGVAVVAFSSFTNAAAAALNFFVLKPG
ncbi:hypothetical protein ACH5RR_014831 [Cinchona calisaya]|uniref:Uncharacterized protein n=1 Tax=Cinchona calisaya TaxID=153742 RepID=A0ABD2ZRE0_9GENT